MSKIDLTAQCPHCQSVNKLPSEAVGRKARCAHCGGVFRVSQVSEVATEPNGQTKSSFLADLAALEATGTEVADTATRCTQCGRPTGVDSTICMDCGVDVSSGKRIKTRIKKQTSEAHPEDIQELPQGVKIVTVLAGLILVISGASCFGAPFTFDDADRNNLGMLGKLTVPWAVLIALALLTPGISLLWLGTQKTINASARPVRLANIIGGVPLALCGASILISGIVNFTDGEVPRSSFIGGSFLWFFVMIAGMKMIASGILGRASRF